MAQSATKQVDAQALQTALDNIENPKDESTTNSRYVSERRERLVVIRIVYNNTRATCVSNEI